MRGAARGLVLIVGLLAALPHAAVALPYSSAIRALDGEQFLEDEPIWMCGDLAPDDPLDEIPVRLVGHLDDGGSVSWGPVVFEGARGLRAELAAWFVPDRRPEIFPLGPFGVGGLRAGRYELRPTGSDTSRVLARFRVIEPRGSELVVRAALARAARLARGEWRERGNIQEVRVGPSRDQIEAVRLYDAVLERYPRTSYRTVIYANLMPLRWLHGIGPVGNGLIEETFAHFNNTCFGEWAVHQYVLWSGNDKAKEQLRRLVGLYPDTRMSRAAARHL